MTARDIARKDAATCLPDELLSDIQARSAELGVCVVVNERSVVFGLLREAELKKDTNLRAEEAMRPGPSTFRANVPITEMAEYMTKHDLVNAPITTPDGELIGVLFREDAVRAASSR